MGDTPTERGSFFDQFKSHSPAFWVFVAVMLGLNGLYDYYNPRGIVIDVVAAVVLIIAYFRCRSAQRWSRCAVWAWRQQVKGARLKAAATTSTAKSRRDGGATKVPLQVPVG